MEKYDFEFDIANEAAQRWVERQDQRPDEEKLKTSTISDVETPERIEMNLERMTKALIQQESKPTPTETAQVPPSVIPTEAVLNVGQMPITVSEPEVPVTATILETPTSLLDDISKERIIGNSDMMGINFLERGIAVGRFVGRINIRNSVGMTAGYGTGFMVSPRLLLTNNHVLRNVTDAKSSLVEFDFQLDRRGTPLPVVAFGLAPEDFFVTNQKLDYTLVAVNPLSLTDTPISHYAWNPLSEEDGKILISQAVNIIQHPKGEYKQMVLRENKLVDLLDNFAHYTADTEPGSSGSPVFSDLWEVVALHHSGVPKTDAQNNLIANDGTIWKKGMDPKKLAWVANEGVRISKLLADFKTKLDGLPLLARQLAEELLGKDAPNPIEVKEEAEKFKHGKTVVVIPPETQTTNQNVTSPQTMTEATWTIPLQIKVGIGVPQMQIAQPTQITQTTASQPIITPQQSTFADTQEAISIDPNYSNRPGYQVDFLGGQTKRVPLPKLSDGLKQQAARLQNISDDDNPFELKYHHYSVVMNKFRKLAFFTAVNIDGNTSKSPNRANDKWFYDPRIKRDEQVGNELYEDNPLDRGHLVRRLDPAWGDDDQTVKVANDDTFHWTNCSPQHKNFNQGKNLWAGLEDYILKNAANKDFKATVFTGPVFDNDDVEHRGIKIPKSYWKVVVMVKKNNKLSATAYLVSQAELVANLEAEFVFGQFKTFQVSIENVEELSGLDFGNLKSLQPANVKKINFDESTTELELMDYSQINL